MRRALALLLALSAMLTGCRTTKPASPQEKPVLPIEIPVGTVFQPVREVEEFDVVPMLRILPDPDSPSDGIAAVKIYVISKGANVRKNVQAAVWLPQGVTQFTPMNVIGTNMDKWEVDLSPQQPKMGLLGRFKFRDFDKNLGAVKAAFEYPTRVKIQWDGGQSFLEVPSEQWQIEVIGRLSPPSDGQ